MNDTIIARYLEFALTRYGESLYWEFAIMSDALLRIRGNERRASNEKRCQWELRKLRNYNLQRTTIKILLTYPSQFLHI